MPPVLSISLCRFISQLRDHLLSHFEPKQFSVNSLAAESSVKSEGYLSSSSRGNFNTINSAALDPLLESHLAERSWTRADSLTGARHVYLVWYRVRSYLSDYAPLILIYLVLLLYIYFSVCEFIDRCIAILKVFLNSPNLFLVSGNSVTLYRQQFVCY